MDYYDSAEGEEITRKRAIREIRKHCTAAELGGMLADFDRDLGNRPTYDAQAVLAWLGY